MWGEQCMLNSKLCKPEMEKIKFPDSAAPILYNPYTSISQFLVSNSIYLLPSLPKNAIKHLLLVKSRIKELLVLPY